MGAAALAVGVRGVLGPVAVAEAEEGEDVVRAGGFVYGEAGDGGVAASLPHLKLGCKATFSDVLIRANDRLGKCIYSSEMESTPRNMQSCDFKLFRTLA